MIHLLTKENENAAFQFLLKDPIINSEFLSFIKQYGLDHKVGTFYAQYDEDRKIRSVMSKMGIVFDITAEEGHDSFEIATYLNMFPDFYQLNGKVDIIQEIRKNLYGDLNYEEVGFAVLNRTDRLTLNNYKIRSINLGEMKEVYEVLKASEDENFSVLPYDQIYLDAFYRFRDGMGRTYALYLNGKIVSTASTRYESSYGSMICNVATLPEYRGRGFAKTIVSKLSKDLVKEGMIPCITYKTRLAMRIYLSIGFERICELGRIKKA